MPPKNLTAKQRAAAATKAAAADDAMVTPTAPQRVKAAPKRAPARKKNEPAAVVVDEMEIDDGSDEQPDVAPAVAKKRKRPSKQTRFLKEHGVTRPQTAFQLWGADIKDTLRKDIANKKPPARRKAAYDRAFNDHGTCDLNKYRGLLWRPKSEGGTGYVTANQKAKWMGVYEDNKAVWLERKQEVMKDYVKRPMTAFLIFYNRDFTPQYKKKTNPDARPAEIAKAAALVWAKKKTQKSFAKYHKEAAQLKEDYEVKKAAFEEKQRLGQEAAAKAAATADDDKPAPPPAKKKKVAEAPKKKVAEAPKKKVAEAPKKKVAEAPKKKATTKVTAAAAAKKTKATAVRKTTAAAAKCAASAAKGKKAAAAKAESAAPKRARAKA